jgi:hypothetical protein
MAYAIVELDGKTLDIRSKIDEYTCTITISYILQIQLQRCDVSGLVCTRADIWRVTPRRAVVLPIVKVSLACTDKEIQAVVDVAGDR